MIRGLGVALWFCAVAGGFAWLYGYGYQPGSRAPLPRTQAQTQAAIWWDQPAHFGLTLFAHPYCPCTRASIEALHRLSTLGGERLAVRVLFVQLAPDWQPGATWARADAIPRASVAWDANGVLARSFGATTSGHVLFQTAEGGIAFEGGITPSRGHQGGCPGVRVMQAELSGEERTGGDPARAPVYGCHLLPAPRALVPRGGPR